MVKGTTKRNNEMGILWNKENFSHDYELRTTKIDQRPMVFMVLFGYRMELETANRYETKVTSLLDIMAWHCISGTVGCVSDIVPLGVWVCSSGIAIGLGPEIAGFFFSFSSWTGEGSKVVWGVCRVRIWLAWNIF